MDTDAREELVALARDLVRLDSENPPGEEGECARFVRDWLESEDIDAELVGDPGRPSVGARVGDPDGPTLVLNGHLDVVPAGDEAEWTHDPYAGVVEDGRLYGRGSADMKGNLALAMLALRDLRDAIDADTRGGSVVFHAAMGEETGEPGTESLLDAGYTGDYGLVLEPTDFRVATSAKGLVCYELTVHGDPSHASRPDQGRNAVLAARALVDAIETYDAALRERADDLVGTAYANITRYAAGLDGNLGVLPENATVVLDRRVLPGESISTVRAEVDDLAADLDVPVSVAEIQRYEPARVPVDCALAELVRDRVAAATGRRPDPWGIEAATDVRNLVNDADVEAVTWGPGNLAQAHTYDEHVALDDLETGYDVLRGVAADLLD
ncbi:M20 family metallopeptidase [Halocalculus aciditolerans]|uniref:Acetylornithine deacetylase n=1 Tax=Halocalculus aciditolerans TaxID=1383812 RepID=A0A830FJZ7_9EURY|nr:M20 family metallopeptidase [Halocalculus aciditolerans]GGL64093.1 acetylornithine deacetylase [Halocalculus aciditolerans]